jgi:hypothetical protein
MNIPIYITWNAETDVTEIELYVTVNTSVQNHTVNFDEQAIKNSAYGYLKYSSYFTVTEGSSNTLHINFDPGETIAETFPSGRVKFLNLIVDDVPAGGVYITWMTQTTLNYFKVQCTTEETINPTYPNQPTYQTATASPSIGDNVSRKPTTTDCSNSTDDGIYAVDVNITDPTYGQKLVETKANGNWCYGAEASTTYTVNPTKEDNELCGLTEDYDLPAIQEHILGIEDFTENWQFIAADANNNQIITAADISCLRHKILSSGPCSAFNSWRFVKAINYTTYSGLDVLDYVGASDCSSNDPTGCDFYGIKIGDLTQTGGDDNCTDCGSFAPKQNTLTRSNDNLNFKYSIEIVNSNTSKIKIYSSTIIHPSLLSLYFLIPGYKISSTKLSSKLSPDDYDFVINQSEFKLIYTSTILALSSFNPDECLIELTLEKEPGISNVIYPQIKLTKGSLINDYDRRFTINLIEKSEELNSSKSDFYLYPNPGSDHIEIYSNSKDPFLFRLFNILGAEVLNKQLEFDHSSKQVVHVSGLSNGSYFYRIESISKNQSGIWIKNN